MMKLTHPNFKLKLFHPNNINFTIQNKIKTSDKQPSKEGPL